MFSWEALFIEEVEKGSPGTRPTSAWIFVGRAGRSDHATLRDVAEVLSRKRTPSADGNRPRRLRGYVQLQRGAADLEVRQ